MRLLNVNLAGDPLAENLESRRTARTFELVVGPACVVLLLRCY